MSFKNTSPYYQTPFNGSYLDIMTMRNIPALSEDVEYEILPQYEYRPDLLAFDLYDDVNLWWVFDVRNKDVIKDPVFDMFAGQKIRIPLMETLQRSLGL